MLNSNIYFRKQYIVSIENNIVNEVRRMTSQKYNDVCFCKRCSIKISINNYDYKIICSFRTEKKEECNIYYFDTLDISFRFAQQIERSVNIKEMNSKTMKTFQK